MVLTGRAKDTIVLSSGENIEPSSIEDAAVCSPLIKFCVLLGQDRRSLGALVVPDPEAWDELEKEKGVYMLFLAWLAHTSSDATDHIPECKFGSEDAMGHTVLVSVLICRDCSVCAGSMSHRQPSSCERCLVFAFALNL